MKYLLLSLYALMIKGVSAGDNISSLTLVNRGREVFMENCIACHGEKGDGHGIAAKAISGAKPRDFTTGYFRRGSKPEQVFHTISEGSEGTDMPAWKDAIPEKDRWSLVHYVKSLKKKNKNKNKNRRK